LVTAGISSEDIKTVKW